MSGQRAKGQTKCWYKGRPPCILTNPKKVRCEELTTPRAVLFSLGWGAAQVRPVLGRQKTYKYCNAKRNTCAMGFTLFSLYCPFFSPKYVILIEISFTVVYTIRSFLKCHALLSSSYLFDLQRYRFCFAVPSKGVSRLPVGKQYNFS